MAHGESTPSSNGILQSWKEIAAHFDVTIRTVQNWEEEKGLPVQRLPGPRGRVWARVEDLEAWRSRRTDLQSDPAAPAVTAVRPSRGIPRWIMWTLAALALVVIGVLAARSLQSRRRDSMISAVRVEGDTLIAMDRRGQALWTHTFDHPVKNLAGLKSNHVDLAPVIHDFDGDGAPDVAIPACHESGQVTDELHFFDKNGTLRWSYRPDFVLRNARKETYSGNWKFRDLRIVPRQGGGADIVLAISHGEMFPGIITRIGADGRSSQTYYHAGHLKKLLVLPSGPGDRPVIYAIGHANGHRMATVVALDAERLSGASAEPPSDAEHTLTGLPQASELARILIPPTPLSLVDALSNTVGRLHLESGRIVVQVLESTSPDRGLVPAQPSYFIVFSPRLQVEHYRLDDAMEVAYRSYHAKGLLPSPDPQPEVDRAVRGIRTLVAWH